MPFSLAAARANAGFSSNTQLAKKVLELWRQRDRKARYKLNALATLIGQIDRRVAWWRKRPDASAALAEALQVDVAELPLGVPTRRGRDRALYAFEDVPELRPLDLVKETPCRAVAPDWWSPDQLFRSTRTWIVAPAGAGRSLLGRWCEARRACRLLSVARLEEAVEAALAEKQDALFIDVQAPDAETDARAADALLGCPQPLVVAAGFEVVAGPAGLARAKGIGVAPRSDGQRLETLVSQMWGREVWQPPAGWRSRFAAWVAERLEQASPAKVQEVVAWLDDADPDASLWRTPGDLLPLLGWAFLEGSLRRLRREDLVKTWLNGRVQRTTIDGSERSAWLRSTAAPAMSSMVSGRLADVGRAWDAPMTLDEWATFLPPELAPRTATDGLAKRIEQVAALPKKADRAREARQVEAETTRSTARVAVQFLIAARLLRAAPGGDYVIHPRWVGAWWAAERAAAALREAPPARWGRMAMEKTRRPLFDDALDALDDKAAAKHIDATLRAFNADDLGSAAAVEAEFAAVVRRLERGGTIDGRRLHALWVHQQQLLVRRVDWRPPEPLTRVALWDAAAEAEWICSMWSFSVRVPLPSSPPPPGSEWLLPGWFETRIAELPDWITRYIDDDQVPIGLRQRYHHLLLQVLPRCTDQSFPAASDNFRYLRIAGILLILAYERSWSIPDDFASHVLLANRQEGQRALRLLEQLPTEDQEKMAATLYGGASRNKETGSWLMLRLYQDSRHWWDWMAERLPEEIIEELARTGIISSQSLQKVDAWPSRLWLAAARGIIASGSVDQFTRLLTDPSPQRTWSVLVVPIIDALLLLPIQDQWMKVRLMELLWALAPEYAVERVRSCYPENEEVHYWFQRGEDHHLPLLLDLLEELGTSPSWVAPWLARQLPRAGADAERAYRLLRRALSASPQ